MADYISREAAIEKIREAGCTDCGGSSGGICGFCDFENAVRLVNGLPAADVEPVRHVWIWRTKMNNKPTYKKRKWRIIARSRIPEHQRSYGERNEDENGRT